MARHSQNRGQRSDRSSDSSGSGGAARRGSSRGARHLNDDFDAGDTRDEDMGNEHDEGYDEHSHDSGNFGDVREGDSTGFGRPLSFQGKGYFPPGAPFERGPAHIGPGNAVGYGPGRQANGGGFRGKGPKGYQRSDERLTEDINDRLTYDDDIDASEISVSVANGEATLTGNVNSRFEKRRAEDVADDVPGISHVQNNLRVKKAPK